MALAVKGIIVQWAFSIASIPAGWALCDGTKGTPDLQNKFIPGAGTLYSPGDTGGGDDHQHPFTSDGHFHTLNVSAGPLGTGTGFENKSNTEQVTGTTDSASSLPPFHALAYIMFL